MKQVTKKVIGAVLVLSAMIALSMVDSMNGNLKGFIGIALGAVGVYLLDGFYFQNEEK